MQFGQGNARYKSPKTILGFFAILIGILGTTTVISVGVLARYPELHPLISDVLIFFASVFLLTLIGVFLTAWKDPSILMLGEVSGEIFLEYKKLTLGDSVAGERVEKFIVQDPAITKEIKTEASPHPSRDSK